MCKKFKVGKKYVIMVIEGCEMYIEKDLIVKINGTRPRLMQKFRRIEKWFQKQEEDLEFYVYEDFNPKYPNKTFYILDVLSDKGRHFTLKQITIGGLYDALKDLQKLVKDKMKLEKKLYRGS